MVIISTMTILELSTALGIVIAGIAGLMKASSCKKVECGIIKGCICEREIIEEPTNDFDRALQSKSNAILNGEKNKEGEDQNENQTKTKAITIPKSSNQFRK